MDIQIANQNYAALAAFPGLGWPPTGLAKGDLDALLEVLHIYTGHSFMVCDAFGNGDSACFVPDPANKDILTQTGPAKNANGQQLPDIANHVAGGGDGGLGVTQNPPHIEYFLPPSDDGAHIVCGYVDGTLSVCIKQE